MVDTLSSLAWNSVPGFMQKNMRRLQDTNIEAKRQLKHSVHWAKNIKWSAPGNQHVRCVTKLNKYGSVLNMYMQAATSRALHNRERQLADSSNFLF